MSGWNEDKLKEMGIRHFSKIFKDDLQTNIVDQLKVLRLFLAFMLSEEAEIFSTEINLGEVEGDLKSFKKHKISGPNGWPMESFLWLFDLVVLQLQHFPKIKKFLGPSFYLFCSALCFV